MAKILLSGEGGQGVQSIAEIFAEAAERIGRFSVYMPSFGVEQRGGVSVAFLQISEKPIRYPKFSRADIVIAMGDRAVEMIEKYAINETLVIFDGKNIDDNLLEPLRGKIKKYLNLPAKELVTKNLSAKVANILFLGALLNEFPEIKIEAVKKIIEEKFAKYIAKQPELKDLNFRALEAGLDFAKNHQNQEFKGVVRQEVQRVYADEHKTWERFPEYCKGCGLCIVRCPVKCLSFSQDLNFLGTQTPQIDIAKCTSCMLCQQTCPDGAIRVTKRDL